MPGCPSSSTRFEHRHGLNRKDALAIPNYKSQKKHASTYQPTNFLEGGVGNWPTTRGPAYARITWVMLHHGVWITILRYSHPRVDVRARTHLEYHLVTLPMASHQACAMPWELGSLTKQPAQDTWLRRQATFCVRHPWSRTYPDP